MTTITMIQKYLIFPVSRAAKNKNVAFFNADGICELDYEVKLDTVHPERYFYVNVERFRGRTFTVNVTPQMIFCPKQCDSFVLMTEHDEYRPQIHFTAPYGWINDPNGLVYANGIWHLFYQWNPAGTGFGTVHWGHAVSTDLIHWKHREAALYPDRNGHVYSGGGLADVRDELGIKNRDGITPILLTYTAAGGKSRASQGKRFEQYYAVSTDNGETFTKYEQPFLPHIEAENRDPKAVYSDTLGIYVMTLFLSDSDNRYGIWVSDHLREWHKVQELVLPGCTACPNFFPMMTDDGEKWVFLAANDRYYVGDFDGKRFTPCSQLQMLQYTEKNAYASQRFEGTDRCIRTAWFMFQAESLGMGFNQALSFPQEMKLITDKDTYRLSVRPIAEIKTLYCQQRLETVHTDRITLPLVFPANDITLTLDTDQRVIMTIFGHEFIMDFTASVFLTSGFTAPFQTHTVRILTDTCGFEIYADNGTAYLAVPTPIDPNLPYLTLSAPIPINGEICISTISQTISD